MTRAGKYMFDEGDVPDNCGNCNYTLKSCPNWPNTYMLMEMIAKSHRPYGCCAWKEQTSPPQKNPEN